MRLLATDPIGGSQGKNIGIIGGRDDFVDEGRQREGRGEFRGPCTWQAVVGGELFGQLKCDDARVLSLAEEA